MTTEACGPFSLGTHEVPGEDFDAQFWVEITDQGMWRLLQDASETRTVVWKADAREALKWLSEEFDIYVSDYEEYGLSQLIAEQEWDSGGPGAGAGVVRIYRIGNVYVETHDAGYELWDTEEQARARSSVWHATDATTRIWDRENGYTYPGTRAPSEESARQRAGRFRTASTVGREDAGQIATDYLREQGFRVCEDRSGEFRVLPGDCDYAVGTAVTLAEIRLRKPVLYNLSLDDSHWIVYLRRQGRELEISSSTIIVISRVGGAVLYFGSASDEG